MWPLLVRWRLDLTRIWLRIFIFLHTLSEVSKGTPVSRESGEEDQAHLLDREPTQLALCLRLALLI